MHATEHTIVEHAFESRDLVGGHLALDFVNTVTARDTAPLDWLQDYAVLLDWARLTGAFRAETLAALRRLAQGEPRRARDALARAKALREAAWGAFMALQGGRRAAGADLDRLQSAWKAAARDAVLAPASPGAQVIWRTQDSGPDLIAHAVAWSAIELLADPRLERLRLCDGTDCGWLFLDTSKSGRRRWCDMATCGNVAKARRHYQRQSGRAKGASA